MSDSRGSVCYTALTFAPVQGFIRSSRKLRDLYGSSLLLSHLAHAICADAASFLGRSDAVISPAGVQISQGVPNTVIIQGDYPKAQARAALLKAWTQVLNVCRSWLEKTIRVEDFQPVPDGWCDWEQGWGASWKAAASHSWEVFHGAGDTIHAARQALLISKQQRDWSVPNWTGESSTLSSAEAVVRPTMARVIPPWKVDAALAAKEASNMLAQLREVLGEAFADFADRKEEISLLELVKRLITYRPILRDAFALDQPLDDQMVEALLRRFVPLSTRQDREQQEKPESIIWFMADGDQIGSYLTRIAQQDGEEQSLRHFSSAMRGWAASLYQAVPLRMGGGEKPKATVVYAGGDDLLGALHETVPGKGDLTTSDLWHWLLEFPSIWEEAKHPELTISMGVVWADATVPQREALQHAREAEATAKTRGRDRFALRLLYASGNHLEWSCPWSWLGPILDSYTDRHGRTAASRDGKAPNWRHLAEDVVWLQERQAMTTETAEALWQAYFPGCVLPEPQRKRAPGDAQYVASHHEPEQGRAFAPWLLNLGRVMAGMEKRQEAVG